mgnify:CR=1 FL=1
MVIDALRARSTLWIPTACLVQAVTLTNIRNVSFVPLTHLNHVSF